MKKNGIFILLFSLSLLGCQAQQDYVKVEDSEVDKNKLEFATSISDQILSAQKDGGFYALSNEEAIEAIVTGLDEKLQKDTYTQIKSLFGDYQGLEFDHLMRSVGEPSYEIYRFKGIFEKPDSEIEVRAVLDSKGKLAGFFIKPWQQQL